MNNCFSRVSEHHSHVYIADYTQQTRSEKGVVIRDNPFNDIQCCTVRNPRGIRCWGINFEDNKAVFRLEGTGNPAPQCECMLAAADVRKGWVCLMELKYCLEKNVGENSEDAFGQLKKCLDHLKGKGIIDLKKHRVYCNISIPDHSHKQPFHGSLFSPDEITELGKTEKIHLLGSNTIKILNEAYLMEITENI